MAEDMAGVAEGTAEEAGGTEADGEAEVSGGTTMAGEGAGEEAGLAPR